MGNISFPSIEEFAAYLEGKLSQDEMQKFSKLAENNIALRQLIDASSEISEDLASVNEHEYQLPNEITSSNFELPNIDDPDFFSPNGDINIDIDNLNIIEGISVDDSLYDELKTTNNNDVMEDNFNGNYRIYGEAGENIYDPIYIEQPDDHSCALRSQQIVLRDFGIDIPFNDLEQIAKEANVYSDTGTLPYDVGRVMEIAGVSMHQVEGSTILDLTSELAQGHRVLVNLDAHELWYNKSIKDKFTNWLSDVFGSQGGNHALIVAGVEVNSLNPDDVKVVLTDTGDGHLRIEYPIKQFMNAWKDSNCFMVATDNAAPYQYDAETGMEVPSNFAVQQQYNQFVIDNGYQLKPDMINVPDDYQPAFKGHLTKIGDMNYEEFMQSLNIDEIEVSGDSFLWKEGEEKGSISFEHIGETTGGVGSTQTSVEGESTEGVDLLKPICETTGGVGDKIGGGGEGSGGVGSCLVGDEGESTVGVSLLKPICEKTGVVGDIIRDGGEGSGGVGSSLIGDGGEGSGGVGSSLIGDEGESTGGVGSSVTIEGSEEMLNIDEGADLDLDSIL